MKFRSVWVMSFNMSAPTHIFAGLVSMRMGSSAGGLNKLLLATS